MNKKAQGGPYPSSDISTANVHPIMVLGIIIFIIPFFGPVVHFKFPRWVGTIGFILMLIGMILSVLQNIDIKLW